MKQTIRLMFTLFTAFLIMSCGGESSSSEDTSQNATISQNTEEANPLDNKGIGPVSSLELGEVNQEMASKGEEIFKAKCTACHKLDKKFIGPSPVGVLDRRSPEWIMNMILNPDEMVQKDADAKKLLMEFNGAPMANQNLSEEDARNVLEYFRTI